MPTRQLEHLRWPQRRPVPRWRARLWRDWCFLRAAWQNFRVNFLLILVLLAIGAVSFRVFEPEKGHSWNRALYNTWALIFNQQPEDYPKHAVLQVLFFIVPLLGLVVIVEGIIDFALMLRDRRRNERSWCKIMAASLSNHIILIGLGKLGYRVFRMLKKLGEPLVIIECDTENQFLEDVRRAGVPLLIGDARREELLSDANAAQARAIILATNVDLVNLEVALDARRINPKIRVVMRMFDQNMADKVCEGFNIQVAMSQSAISAPAFVLAALERSIVSSMVIGDQLVVVQRWTVQPGSALADLTIAEAMKRYRISILEHRRGSGEPRLIPPPDLELRVGDELLVQAPLETLANLRELARHEPGLASGVTLGVARASGSTE